MHANLVRSSRQQIHVEQRVFLPALHNRVLGDRRSAFAHHHHFFAVARMAKNRRFDSPQFRRNAANQRQIILLHAALGEVGRQFPVRSSVLQTTMTPVVSLSSRCTIPAAFGRADVRQNVRSVRLQNIDQSRAGFARAGVNHHAARLVQNHYVVVFIAESGGSSTSTMTIFRVMTISVGAATSITSTRSPILSRYLRRFGGRVVDGCGFDQLLRASARNLQLRGQENVQSRSGVYRFRFRPAFVRYTFGHEKDYRSLRRSWRGFPPFRVLDRRGETRA